MPMESVTFRDHSAKIEFAEELWEEGPFKGKSEFYRFVGDFTLDTLIERYQPQMDGDRYEELLEDLEEYPGAAEMVAEAERKLSPTVKHAGKPALEYATRIQMILESGVDPEEQVAEALEETDRFINHYFPESYAASRLEEE